MDLQIKGKTALITGGSGGLGFAAARLLHAEGVSLTLTDLDADALERAASELGDDVATHAADLTDTAQIGALADKLREAGGCDILVHAAGVTGEKGDPLEMTDEEYHRVWETNFLSAVRLARAMVPQMAEKGWGRMVCVTSENAVQPYVEEAVYNTAKAALLNFTKGLAQAYAGKGVLINTVSPAFIETPMTDGMMEKRAEQLGVSRDEAIESFLKEERPFLKIGRRGRADEVAPAIALLCSSIASFTSGSAWRVDGGAVGAMNT
ncbi:NAD(P)-dependent dehydrogenase (short-subunit alcohol dehydrogenase family) [Palleronia aestuarii]|uniref:NAD(P)-dependent dehydrogenase (Short-subunit alcohol dehydrogenase family) n=1 Tax=Palleronia aestuarii TaxID=568105 RepID=A0A2W7N4L0_9RHOB|nr:SDR family oxidoreductase [Palleronia aestuarii]PZX15011.1 NAD(P)-dependent dehydrogenase (short-subunit alcohol dehydrogenase family) [Palleronia aestuarii]